LFDELVMSLWDSELLLVDWIMRLKVNLVLEAFVQPWVVFVNAQSILLFA
jgi:hypothetical protein